MSSSRRRPGDFCVLGASGFYGAQAVVALAGLASRYALARPSAIAAPAAGPDAVVVVVAGRSPRKLDAMLPGLQRQADDAGAGGGARRRVRLEVLPLPVDVSGGEGEGGGGGGGGGDSGNVRALAMAAPVLLNCIRPVQYEWSERVMAACAECGTAYLDLCARPAFLSAVREMFGGGGGGGGGCGGSEQQPPPPPPPPSRPCAPPLVPGCGFDYALPDVATWHALQLYRAKHGGRMPARVRTTFLVHTPPAAGAGGAAAAARGRGGGGSGGGGFKLRLGAVDELLAPPAGGGGGHRGWDPRRADVQAALERAAERRGRLEARGLATAAAAPPERSSSSFLPRHEPTGLAAGPRWTLPFFVGGGVEADLLRANLTEGVEEEEEGCGGGGGGGGDGGGISGSGGRGAPPPPAAPLAPLQFDCRIALPPFPSARALLALLLCWPLLLAVALPLLCAIVLGAALARRSPPRSPYGLRGLYLAALPYLTLGLVTADDDLARRSADASVFERVCVLSGGDDDDDQGGGGGGGGIGGASGGKRKKKRQQLRVSFRGSFAQSLTPQCIAAAAVCLLNEQAAAAKGAGGVPLLPPPARAAAARVLTPAQALLSRAPPAGSPTFLDMLCARHGLVIEVDEVEDEAEEEL
jgi:hypothetical protein